MATSAFDIVIIALGLAVVAYIFMLLCSFIYTVSCLDEQEILLLRAYSNWDFGYYTPVVIMPVIVATSPEQLANVGYYQQPAEGPAPTAPVAYPQYAAYVPPGGYRPPHVKYGESPPAAVPAVPSVSSSPSSSSSPVPEAAADRGGVGTGRSPPVV